MSGRAVVAAVIVGSAAGLLFPEWGPPLDALWGQQVPRSAAVEASCTPPRCTPEAIYGLARGAGFDPGEATTMTAVALAESRGRPDAHNTHGEDSRGLWQINLAAHADHVGTVDLYDPAENAKAAFAVSREGADVSPWTTTHRRRGAPYLQHRAAAEAAAHAYGDGRTEGMWVGTAGYGDGGGRS